MSTPLVDHTAAGSAAHAEPTVEPWQARLSGVLAAVVALAVGELLSSLAGDEQSQIASVGTSFIEQFAAQLKNLAVAIFGTSDKAALVIGIVVVSAFIGSALGTATLRRGWVGPAGFAAFGAFGLYAGLADPQTDRAIVVIAALGSTAAGVAVLLVLLRVAAGRPALPVTTTQQRSRAGARARASVAEWPTERAKVTEHPTSPASSRRAFFGWAGAAGAFAVGTAVAGRAFSGRSKAEIALEGVKLPSVTRAVTPPGTVPGAPMGVPGLSPYYVDNEDFYRIDTALIVPQVDPADWKLSVTGLVDHPFELTFDELLAMAQTEEAVTLSCVSNSVGGDLVGNARWQGVPLSVILERAGVQAGATQIIATSVDGWTAGFPTAVATDGRVAMVAVGMNGQPLPIPHGFPARLVVAGLYGYVSATKWLTEIRLTTWEDDDGYWIDKGWSKEGPVKTQSRIDVPRARSSIPAGAAKIAGVAWAPDRGITKVEVQVDEGEWYDAMLGEVVSDSTWVQWVFDWNATPGRHTIQARATDGTGQTQTSAYTSPDPDGATGYPSVRVDVDD